MPTTKTRYDGKTKAEMFHILRREILAARLKVTLDKQLGRLTSDTVRRLAAMDLPPIITEDPAPPAHQGSDHCCCCCQGSERP